MSVLSNHFPEVLDQLNGVCTCTPQGNDAGQMCPGCRAEYDAWLDSTVPCGQIYPDGPLPADVPF
jgi:hypothetical protein